MASKLILFDFLNYFLFLRTGSLLSVGRMCFLISASEERRVLFFHWTTDLQFIFLAIILALSVSLPHVLLLLLLARKMCEQFSADAAAYCQTMLS